MNASRFLSFALVMIAALLAGCAGGVVGGQAVYRGSQGAVAVGGQTRIPTGHIAPASHQYDRGERACDGGYRLINGAWRCMGGYRIIERGPAYARHGVPCKVNMTKNGERVISETIRVASEAECDKLEGVVEGIVDEVKDGERESGRHNYDAGRSRYARDEHRKPDVQESVIPAKGENDTCRLRVRGKVIAEVDVPPGSDSKKYCNDWQRGEARKRGLL